MVPRSLVPLTLAAALLASGGASAADYRPGDFLNLDLSKAVFSKIPLGPPTAFAPVAVEAKSDAQRDRGSEPAWARNELKVEPKQVPIRTVRAAQPRRPTHVASVKAPWRRACETRASPIPRSDRCPGHGYAHSDLAVPVRRRHLRLEAVANSPTIRFGGGRTACLPLAVLRLIGLQARS